MGSGKERNASAFSRRDILSTVAIAGGVLTAASASIAQTADQPPNPSREPGVGGADPVPGDVARERENPDMLNPPATDSGTTPNLRFSFADAHVRQSSGGWTRQVTPRELGVSKSIAGVNMRLNAGGVRELHGHKQAEWAYMLYGAARITAINAQGRNFVDDVGVGDLWYFPGGIPHSIQGLAPDGCEFLLVFDDGDFDEDSTFLLSDWFKHVPPEVLGKNFGTPASLFGHTPDPRELYIFKAPVPAPLGPDKLNGAEPVPQSFSHRMMAQEPVRTNALPIPAYFPPPRTSRRPLWKWNRADCGSYIGTLTPTSGNITSAGRLAWACSRRPAKRERSISKAETSAMFRSPWVTTWRIPAPRHCGSWRYSRAVITPIYR